MLSAKQESFCLEYIKHKNATRAYKTAYGVTNERTARSNGSRLLINADVKARIDSLLAELAERNKLKADDVINELKSMAFWNINDFVEDGNSIRDISKLSKRKNKPVIGIKTKVEKKKYGDSLEIEEKTVELKFADKRAALVDLGRHLGIFKEDNDQKATKIKVTRK
jgi:phage terminase small subunit